MKKLIAYVFAIAALLSCRAEDKQNEPPSCVVRAVALLGLKTEARPGDAVFSDTVYKKVREIGDRGKIIEWLCSESDAKQIGFVLDYKGNAFILRFSSVENAVGYDLLLQFVFDREHKLERVHARLQNLGPYP